MNQAFEKMPSVSIIVPSLGRDQRLKSCIEDLCRQDYEAWECLVVLQGKLDPYLITELRSTLSVRLRIFHCEEPNASLARNIGLKEAKGDVVIFLDDDVEIQDMCFIKRHASHYRDPAMVGVVGQVLAPLERPRTTRHWISRYPSSGWLFFPANYSKATRIRSGRTANLSVRRSFAVAVGGMDAQYEKGAHREESDFTLRLVYRFGSLLFDPKASLVHFGEPIGGCRSWGHNSGIHPLHHVCGEWYFILKALKLRTLAAFDVPLHLYSLLRYQVLNSANMASLSHVTAALRRSLEGFQLARCKLSEGPKYLETLSSSYREIPISEFLESAPVETALFSQG